MKIHFLYKENIKFYEKNYCDLNIEIMSYLRLFISSKNNKLCSYNEFKYYFFHKTVKLWHILESIFLSTSKVLTIFTANTVIQAFKA